MHEFGEISLEQRKDGLRLWVTKADVVFQNLCAALGHHQASEETADESVARLLHAVNCGLQNSLVDVVELFLADDTVRAGSVGAHTTSVWAGVSISDSLVVLSRGQRGDDFTVTEGEDGALFSLEELFDDDAIACIAELACEHDVLECLSGLFFCLRNDDTLACSQAVCFDDDVMVNGVEVFGGSIVVAKVLVGSCWDVVLLHEVLGEGLAALHASCRLAGTKDVDTVDILLEVVGDSCYEGRFWAGYQEVDLFLVGEFGEGREVFLRNFVDIGHLLQAAISGQSPRN